MNNGRFATALHILTLLQYQKDEWLTSDLIAGSININPVLVRKEIGNLKAHGLVQSREGKGGGTMLAKPAESILLSDIYRVVRQSSLLGRSNEPNPNCPVGRQINEHINSVFDEADKAVLQRLGKTTLAEFTMKFH